jgi:cell fate (sporulation/competence/biofilm development) regulator YmcA (YheA/YmcA/DUF963 family)
MNRPGDALIHALKNDARVKRFNELEAIIETHPEYYKKYEAIKLAQQKYVRAQAYKSKDEALLKARYEEEKKALVENPFIEEYLDLMEELNDDLQWMIQEIETQLNLELKEDAHGDKTKLS